jgi:hypothetical protein
MRLHRLRPHEERSRRDTGHASGQRNRSERARRDAAPCGSNHPADPPGVTRRRDAAPRASSASVRRRSIEHGSTILEVTRSTRSHSSSRNAESTRDRRDFGACGCDVLARPSRRLSAQPGSARDTAARRRSRKSQRGATEARRDRCPGEAQYKEALNEFPLVASMPIIERARKNPRGLVFLPPFAKEPSGSVFKNR